MVLSEFSSFRDARERVISDEPNVWSSSSSTWALSQGPRASQRTYEVILVNYGMSFGPYYAKLDRKKASCWWICGTGLGASGFKKRRRQQCNSPRETQNVLNLPSSLRHRRAVRISTISFWWLKGSMEWYKLGEGWWCRLRPVLNFLQT